MKNFISIFVLLVITSFGFSQALQKGNFDAHLGVGFGIYTFSTNNYEDNSSPAVPGLINLGLAYQISDAFSLGADYERNGFVTDSDSNSKAVSQNIGITISYNAINSDNNVLSPFIHVGNSNFRFDNFNDQEYVTSSGVQIQLGAAWKHYFGETVGMFLNLSIPYYSYNEFKDSKGNVYEDSRLVSDGQGNTTIETRVVNGKMTGVNFRAGLTFKFGG